MNEFEEAKKNFMDARTRHADLVNDLKKKLVQLPKMPKLRKIDADLIAKEARRHDFPKLPQALADIDRLAWATAWMHPDVKYRGSVRKMHSDIEAHNEILTQARRKYARAIKSEIEAQPDFKAMCEQIGQAYWARVIAGIHMEWNQLVSEYLKQPGNDELRRIKAEFVEKYNI